MGTLNSNLINPQQNLKITILTPTTTPTILNLPIRQIILSNITPTSISLNNLTRTPTITNNNNRMVSRYQRIPLTLQVQISLIINTTRITMKITWRVNSNI